MGLENGHVFHQVAHDRFRVAGGADDDQGLRREIDVLLVFRHVRGNCSIAQFAQLDADLVRRGLVGAAAHDGPVALLLRQELRGMPDEILPG